jgi:thioredoxin reductase (NADPH)
MEDNIYDTVIIGSGPAGLTAAVYNIRAFLKTVVIAGNQPGGQLTITTTVENWPGFPNGIGGVKLMMDMQQQVKNLGGEIRQENVRVINKSNEHFEVWLDSNKQLSGKAVLVATGAQARWLGIPGEKQLIGKGVSGCATCDAAFFKGKTVAVVGGGDTACEEAELLTKFVDKVYLIHRREELRAGEIEKKRVKENPKIEIWWNTEVKEAIGQMKLEKIRIWNNKTDEEKVVEVDGLFVAIGRIPATGMVQGLVDLREEGQIITGKDEKYKSMSSVPGIFAAGDCVNVDYRQAIIAAGDGARAALEMGRWLKESRY